MSYFSLGLSLTFDLPLSDSFLKLIEKKIVISYFLYRKILLLYDDFPKLLYICS